MLITISKSTSMAVQSCVFTAFFFAVEAFDSVMLPDPFEVAFDMVRLNLHGPSASSNATFRNRSAKRLDVSAPVRADALHARKQIVLPWILNSNFISCSQENRQNRTSDNDMRRFQIASAGQL
ncbi:MAG: hypothetical protein U0798_11290 [Gemmataceae bacterium]